MEERELKKKKHKKSKKQKKISKSSHHSSSDSESEAEWVEAQISRTPDIQAPNKAEIQLDKKSQRDDWMQAVDSFGPTVSRNEIKGRKKHENAIKNEAKAAKEKLAAEERELNPYWKDGGSGLPAESQEKLQDEVKNQSTVGDGGLNWLRKAYRRVIEQAEEEGRSLEDVAAERWGSLDKLKDMLRSAEDKHAEQRKTKHIREDPPSHRFYSGSERKYKSGGHRYHSKHHERRDRDDYISSSQKRDSRHSSKEKIKYSERRDYSSEEDNKPSAKEKQPTERRDYGGYSSLEKKRENRPSRSPSREKHFDIDRKNYISETDTKLSVKKEQYVEPKKAFIKPVSQSYQNFSSEQTVSGYVFAKPDDDDSDVISNFKEKIDMNTKSASYSSSRIPSWKKKEFIEKIEEKSASIPLPSKSADVVSFENNDKIPEKIGSTESSDTSSILSDQEMNELGAKILKAELIGNQELAQKLKNKLEGARKAKEESGSSKTEKSNKGSQEEIILLTKTDNRGMTRPLYLNDNTEATTNRRKKQKVETHEAGSRVRYFPDDDKYSLKQMFEREKLTTAEDQNAAFAALAGKSMPRLNADFDIDDAFISKANIKESQAKLDARERLSAIGEYKRKQSTLEKCQHCFENSQLPKHLIISVGKKVYLRLPSYTSLHEGHCFVVPMIHTTAGTYLDEDELEEMKAYKRALTEMFGKMEQDIVFFETSMGLKYFPHMILECVPIPRDVGDTAAIYFKKAILESESEWSNNKKLVDYNNKDIGRVVPKGLPYFSVEFGMDFGFAHVIEDEKLFPKYFAQEIIGGMLDVEPRLWRNPPKQKFEDQRIKVLQFAEWWKPYEEVFVTK